MSKIDIQNSLLRFLNLRLLSYWNKRTQDFNHGWVKNVTFVARSNGIFQAKVMLNGDLVSSIGFGKKAALDRLREKLRMMIAKKPD